MSLYIDIEKELESFRLKVKFEQDDNILGLLGQSGAGKSMTLKCIAGIETPSKGKIILNNKILFDSEKGINLPIQERKVGFLFQNYALFPHMTVKENIEIGLFYLNKQESKNTSEKYIKQFKLQGLEDRYPYQLSGGQAQRVALARVLATSPEIIILDEPFSALDYHLRRDMESELHDILNNYKKSVIFVTHDINEAFRVCDDIIIYDNGIAKNKREVNDLLENPKSIMEAKICGCNNISKIEYVYDNKVNAIDFGYIYDEDKSMSKEFNYIGIRAENIKLNLDKDGCFRVEKITKDLFGYLILVKNIQSTVYKYISIYLYTENIEFKEDDKVSLSIDKNKIFYLK